MILHCDLYLSNCRNICKLPVCYSHTGLKLYWCLWMNEGGLHILSPYKSPTSGQEVYCLLCGFFLRKENPAISGVICLWKEEAIVSLVFLNNPNTSMYN